MKWYRGYAQPGIYVTAEQIPGDLQLEDSLMEVVRPVNASSGVPYHQKMSVGEGVHRMEKDEPE